MKQYWGAEPHGALQQIPPLVGRALEEDFPDLFGPNLFEPLGRGARGIVRPCGGDHRGGQFRRGDRSRARQRKGQHPAVIFLRERGDPGPFLLGGLPEGVRSLPLPPLECADEGGAAGVAHQVGQLPDGDFGLEEQPEGGL